MILEESSNDIIKTTSPDRWMGITTILRGVTAAVNLFPLSAVQNNEIQEPVLPVQSGFNSDSFLLFARKKIVTEPLPGLAKNSKIVSEQIDRSGNTYCNVSRQAPQSSCNHDQSVEANSSDLPKNINSKPPVEVNFRNSIGQPEQSPDPARILLPMNLTVNVRDLDGSVREFRARKKASIDKQLLLTKLGHEDTKRSQKISSYRPLCCVYSNQLPNLLSHRKVKMVHRNKTTKGLGKDNVGEKHFTTPPTSHLGTVFRFEYENISSDRNGNSDNDINQINQLNSGASVTKGSFNNRSTNNKRGGSTVKELIPGNHSLGSRIVTHASNCGEQIAHHVNHSTLTIHQNSMKPERTKSCINIAPLGQPCCNSSKNKHSQQMQSLQKAVVCFPRVSNDTPQTVGVATSEIEEVLPTIEHATTVMRSPMPNSKTSGILCKDSLAEKKSRSKTLSNTVEKICKVLPISTIQRNSSNGQDSSSCASRASDNVNTTPQTSKHKDTKKGFRQHESEQSIVMFDSQGNNATESVENMLSRKTSATVETEQHSPPVADTLYKQIMIPFKTINSKIRSVFGIKDTKKSKDASPENQNAKLIGIGSGFVLVALTASGIYAARYGCCWRGRRKSESNTFPPRVAGNWLTREEFENHFANQGLDWELATLRCDQHLAR